jgi:hypothetical protein
MDGYKVSKINNSGLKSKVCEAVLIGLPLISLILVIWAGYWLIP